ncbi:MAG: alanine--tRNA ligase [Oscillospiraceae bacterium]|jgi:alanyl-tRNA synthetase|nr:alanine--tRNA ligase [Oscillospiraceae bacterium]
MQYMGLNEIREKFLSFFESKGHLRKQSFSLVPGGDASLLLINSGMAPLKPYFSGEVTPPRARMTTCQKCIRTPDIERVGRTSRHGTFFEMLGNFSFGDYFKRDAINWAWEFLTGVMEIPPDRLHVSVFYEDDEAADIWLNEVGIDPSHLSRLGKEDNFWEIGQGPCGPDSEIFFDRGAENGCGKPDCKVGCDCDRFVEIWNLVFTQFNNDGAGNYTPLKNKNIDTGMGLERLACTMQGVSNLFEVDTIQNIMKHAARIAGVEYKKDEKTDVSLRVITDHIRSTTMLVCDGVLPSNEGRGYVLRRLLRRAARHGKLLGIEGPFLKELSETVISESRAAYPELAEKREFIQSVIAMEEERFRLTIDAGMKLLADHIARIKERNLKVLDGGDAFKLYDTYGFPVDLTLEILSENGLDLLTDKFEELMREQKTRARAARASLGDLGWASVDLGLDKDLKTEFTGYTSFKEAARILAIVSDGELAAVASDGQTVSVVLDKTPFYAESGGQVADHGRIFTSGGTLEVFDVKKTNDGKYVHSGRMTGGKLETGEVCEAEIDAERRRRIARAHSATHLLQRALRNNVGSHIEQAGSLVEPDELRFDFSHFQALSAEELARVEREVNDRILEGLTVTVSEMPIGEAKKLGAMALFGEKYGDVVRVVKMGGYSTELCGGTHLDNTAKVGPFKIVSEASVAAGVRRIEAKVGSAVLDDYDRLSNVIRGVAELLKTSTGDLLIRARQSMEENRQLRRELEKLRAKQAAGEVEGYLGGAREINGVKVITLHIKDADPQALRQMGDWLRDKEPNVVAVLCGGGERVNFLAVCGKEAVKKGFHAGNIVKEVCSAAGGSGGGKPDSAMGGGKEPARVSGALAMVDDLVRGVKA